MRHDAGRTVLKNREQRHHIIAVASRQDDFIGGNNSKIQQYSQSIAANWENGDLAQRVSTLIEVSDEAAALIAGIKGNVA